MRVVFICGKCGKRYMNKHPALCHVPKCAAPAPPPVEAPVTGEVHTCGVCGEVYQTKNGLSQHERHQQDAGARNNVQRSKEHSSTNDRTPARENGQQIRDKRATLVYKRRMAEFLAAEYGEEDEAEEEGVEKRRDVPEEARDLPVPPGVPPHPEAEADKEEEIDVPAVVDELPVPPGVPPHLNAGEACTDTDTAVSGNKSPDSLPVSAWREGIARMVLNVEIPNAIPPGAAACVQLLEGVLATIVENHGELPSEETLEKVDAEVCNVLSANGETRKTRNKRSKRKNRSRKEYIYARTQELYKENPSLLAKHAREGTSWAEEPKADLETAEIRKLYNSLWGRKPHIKLPELGKAEPETALDIVLTPISAKEVKTRLARIKANVAPSPDGLIKRDVSRAADIEVLRLWYNIIMVRGYQPAAWRVNRTTLLPKEGQDKSKVTNYRPITISSILSRLYWGIVDQKLRSVITMTPRQKGFTSEAGCFNNVHILNELLRHAKVSEGLVVAQLDVSKAFNTVPHEVIGVALRKKELPEFVACAKTAPQASDLLGYAEGYLNGLGMKISATKCAAFRINTTKDSWYLADSRLTLLSRESIPHQGPKRESLLSDQPNKKAGAETIPKGESNLHLPSLTLPVPVGTGSTASNLS
ncbi:PREDICTED: uncharacterized protein LOC105449135 [Wasmannia auropunctata]|uniref:uncharacterized protein LOC105449135 n=1 Tax=Wasmannia auropunctata TaxID=64793 RepID=UPI0005ED9A9D|nr:PREDICTED: uncharacterized protein LOC105449135 [Wasmannia auropunctata]